LAHAATFLNYYYYYSGFQHSLEKYDILFVLFFHSYLDRDPDLETTQSMDKYLCF